MRQLLFWCWAKEIIQNENRQLLLESITNYLLLC